MHVPTIPLKREEANPQRASLNVIIRRAVAVDSMEEFIATGAEQREEGARHERAG